MTLANRLSAISNLSTPSLGITFIRQTPQLPVENFQLPLSGSRSDWCVCGNDYDNGSFQLPLSGSHVLPSLSEIKRGDLAAFNSLSRDHRTGPPSTRRHLSFSVFQLPLSGSRLDSVIYLALGRGTFNSLSRDHVNSCSLSTLIVNIRPFQLPLSGSHCYCSENDSQEDN